MAVVFISPKQRQKMFFMGITAGVLLFLVVIALFVFLSAPSQGKNSQSQLVFNKPKVSINFAVLDSDQFKSLEAFPEIQLQYSYTANAKDGKTTQGMVSAGSIDRAKTMLENSGLTVISIQEVKIGRSNPFAPYPQVLTATK